MKLDIIILFQILTRRLRFRLERAPGETTLIDRTGRGLKMEPLTTVSQLEKHLVKMVDFLYFFNTSKTSHTLIVNVFEVRETNLNILCIKISFTHPSIH